MSRHGERGRSTVARGEAGRESLGLSAGEKDGGLVKKQASGEEGLIDEYQREEGVDHS